MSFAHLHQPGYDKARRVHRDNLLTGLALGAGGLVYSLVNHGVTITPSTSDVLTVDGVNWPVQEVIPMDSAGYVISWLVKVLGPGSPVASLFALFIPQGSDALITSDGDTFRARA